MGFNVINMDTWNRKDCFNHFFYHAKCTYSITVNIDITNLYKFIKTNKLRLYPTFTWVVSKAINNYEEFKMAFDKEGRLGFFDENNKIIMPVTIQVHHAVANGYHCSLFFSDVSEISLNPEKYLK